MADRIEGNRPTSTPFWREQGSKVVWTPAASCALVAGGRYALVPANDAA